MGSHTTAAGAGPGDLGDFRVFRAQECPGPVTCRCAVGQIAAEFGVVRPTIYRHLGKSASTPVRPRVRPGRRLGLTSATAPPANWDGKATVPEFSSSGLSCCPLRPFAAWYWPTGRGRPDGRQRSDSWVPRDRSRLQRAHPVQHCEGNGKVAEVGGDVGGCGDLPGQVGQIAA